MYVCMYEFTIANGISLICLRLLVDLLYLKLLRTCIDCMLFDGATSETRISFGERLLLLLNEQII